MKLIKQQHQNSCAPTRLAMLFQITYLHSKSLLYKRNWDKKGVSIDELLCVIKNYGYKVKLSNKKYLSALNSNAILIINHSKYGPPGKQLHAVVWDYDKQKVLDPYHGRQLRKLTYEKSIKFIIQYAR